MTLDLFGGPALPDGFSYKAEILSPSDERQLLEQIAQLPFKEFEFHGFKGKRRVVSFGWKYDFTDATFRKIDPIPDFLMPIRQQATVALARPPEAFEQVLVTEYAPGAGIGWHKDKPVFGEIIGISLAAACILRLRRRLTEKWQRISSVLAPRSAYLFSGEVRSDWEHSIPSVTETRYSLTFRTLAEHRRPV